MAEKAAKGRRPGLIRFLHAYFPVRTVFLGASEACWVMLSFVLAAIALLGAENASLMLNYEQGFLKIALIAGMSVTCMYYFDLYDSNVLGNRREVITRMIQMLGAVCVLLAAVYYAYPDMRLARGILGMGFILVGIALLVWRQIFLMVNSMPQFGERTLIFGNGPLAHALISELRSRPELGIRIVEHLRELDGTLNCNPSDQFTPIQPFGLTELEELVRAKRLERVIVALEDYRGKLPVAALLQLKSRGIRVEDAAEVYQTTTGKFSIESMRLSSLLFSPGFSVSRPLLIYKRIFSFLVSLIGLIVAAPLMGLIALAIRLDSVGPVIFKQKRVGKDGKIFTLFKFRTMGHRADRDENHLPAQDRDGRFTRVGRWLRRARIDELPQLFNILHGDMDFVGPRPFVPNQEQECVEKIPFYRQRWVVKPGLTGWAQINRGYCATVEDNAEKLAYDLFYIKNISPGLDILILFKTIKILLLGRGSR